MKASKTRGSKIVGSPGRNRVCLGGLGWPVGNGTKDVGALTPEVTGRIVSGNPGQPHKGLSQGSLRKSSFLQKGLSELAVSCATRQKARVSEDTLTDFLSNPFPPPCPQSAG